MDLHLSNNPTLKTPEPEPESDTPTRIQPVKALTFTNGVLKRYPSLNHHHPIVVTYKECLKNHAAAIGGHAVDGCGEFMPSPTANPADPTSLKCAACGCHRNFHRREPDDPIPLPLPAPPITATATATPALEYQPHNRHHPPQPPRGDSGISSPNSSPSPPPISSTYYPSAPHVLLALSHGLSAATATATTTPPSDGSSRKRHRTRFSQDQKQRMLEFSERLGWKMQKRDEDVINDFCREIGVDRGVFKVWMHNNKNQFGQKKDAVFLAGSLNGNGNGNGNGVSYGAAATVHDGNGESKDNIIIGVHNNNHSSGVHVVGTNGSSSTS